MKTFLQYATESIPSLPRVFSFPKAAAAAQRPAPPTTSAPVVLHVRVCAGAGGGPDKTILRGAAVLDPSRVRVAAAYIHPKADGGADLIRQQAEAFGCPLHQIFESGPLDPRTLRELIQLCRRLRVAVWHGHDYKSNALGLLVRRFWPMKLVTTVHGWTRETARTRLYYHVDNLCLTRYDAVMAVSPALYRHSLRLGVAKERLSYIPNGIDTDAFRRREAIAESRRDLGIDRDRFVIGAVGRFSPEKGFDRAVRTLAQLRRAYPQAELHLIGDGPEYGNLMALARDLGQHEAVRFWGWQCESKRFYETMDMLLLPSHTEGLPNVVLEAMAMGVPVAATDVGGVRELLKGGHSGVILQAEQREWADAVAPLIDEPALRAKYARRGRRRVVKHYTFAKRMEREMRVYDRVLTLESGGMREAA